MKRKVGDNLIIGLVLIFLFLPIVVLVIYSFNKSSTNIVFDGFTLKWYRELFSNTNLIDAFSNTILVAVVSTIISTVIGTISAVGLYKYDFKFKGMINALLYIPIVIPEIVLGISLLSVYTLMKLELGIFTLLLAHVTFSIPYVIVSVRSSLSNSISLQEEASYDLGVGKFKTFWYVTLPNIIPGIVSGATLAFTLSLDDVIVSYFTVGPGSNTLPQYIYSMIKTGITPDVNALSSLVLLVVVIVLTLLVIYDARKIKLEARK